MYAIDWPDNTALMFIVYTCELGALIHPSISMNLGYILQYTCNPQSSSLTFSNTSVIPLTLSFSRGQLLSLTTHRVNDVQ